MARRALRQTGPGWYRRGVAESEDKLARARWIEARLKDLPKLAVFFYQVMLDKNVPEECKTHAFATLFYVLERGDILDEADPALAWLDDIAFACQCSIEVIARAPAAALARHEEVLLRQGVKLRALAAEAPARFDRFLRALAPQYRERVKRRAVFFKNAVQTGELVRLLQRFLESYTPVRWTPAELAGVEDYLENFRSFPSAKQPVPQVRAFEPEKLAE